MHKIYLLFLSTFSILSSLAFGDAAYIVGQDNGNGNAALWITDLNGANQTEIILSQAQSSAQAVAVSSNIITPNYVYCVGADTTTGHQLPTLWITNLDGSYVQKFTLTQLYNNGSAFAVALSSNTLYISGYDQNSPVLWTANLDGTNIIEHILQNNQGSSSTGYGLAINSNDVYLSGYANNKGSFWITSLDGTSSTQYLLTPTNINNLGYSLALSSHQGYIAGTYNNNSGNRQASLWLANLTNGINTQYLLSLNYPTQAFDVDLSSQYAYIAGFDLYTLINTASLWITDLNGSIISQTLLTSNSASTAYSVALSSKNAYIAGYSGSNGSPIKALLWITNLNGSQVSQYTLTSQGVSQALGVALFFTPPSASSLIKNGLSEYGPIIPLRGLK